MKAAVMYGPNDIRYEEIAKPHCPKDGLLIRVCAVGLCGSDIRNMTSDSLSGDYPHIFGHEIVGEIVEIGPQVTGYVTGEHIYVYPVAHCGTCVPCRAGESQMCENPTDYIHRQGGFADYYVVTATQLNRDAVFKIPEGKDLIAATLAEPLSSVYACQDNIHVQYGDTVAVLGAGPIGCFHVQLARLRGALKVILVDINKTRLDVAKRFCPDFIIDSSQEDVIQSVMDITHGLGADKVICANPSTQSQNDALYLARKNGIVVWFGGVAKDKLALIDTNRVHYHGLWIYGHYGANSIQVEKAFQLSLSDTFEAEKFITHVLPLSQINQGIALTKSGEAMKVVLIPNEEVNKHLQ